MREWQLVLGSCTGTGMNVATTQYKYNDNSVFNSLFLNIPHTQSTQSPTWKWFGKEGFSLKSDITLPLLHFGFGKIKPNHNVSL